MEDQRTWTGNIHREYGLKSLRREYLHDNPIVQFGKWFEEGSPTVLEPNAMAVATADVHGRPSVRMVLMKSFGESGIVFATSYRSRKGDELAENSAGAILFYWPQLERQIRVTGEFTKTTPQESDEIFNGRHPKSRIAARASRQSQPIESRELLEKEFENEAKRWNDDNIERPDSWGGYRLIPEEFEFWQGGENRLHDRFLYRRLAYQWQILRLQP